MVYGGHFYLVWDTEIHTLRCRGHSALDRKQPIYAVVGRIRAEGLSQDHWDDRADDRGSPDRGSGDPDGVCRGGGYGLRDVPLNHVVRFYHFWDHSEELDRLPGRLDVGRAVSAEGYCAACRVVYAASRTAVAMRNRTERGSDTRVLSV
jgi:hypothetical protein